MTKERTCTDAIKGSHPKRPVGKHKTNTMQGKITDNETTTIAMLDELGPKFQHGIRAYPRSMVGSLGSHSRYHSWAVGVLKVPH